MKVFIRCKKKEYKVFSEFGCRSTLNILTAAFALLLTLCLSNYLVDTMGFCVLFFELAFALVLTCYPLNYLVDAMGFFFSIAIGSRVL